VVGIDSENWRFRLERSWSSKTIEKVEFTSVNEFAAGI
jgi:hypothetical protein